MILIVVVVGFFRHTVVFSSVRHVLAVSLIMFSPETERLSLSRVKDTSGHIPTPFFVDSKRLLLSQVFRLRNEL